METSNEQTDSSTSEDEISKDVLKETIDLQFLNDNLYPIGKDKPESQSEKLGKSNRKSLRNNWKQENEFTNFGVSGAFQTFVAKKLDQLLERNIKETKHATDVESHQNRNENSGVKLLSSSKDFLTTTDIHIKHDKKPEKRKKHRKIMEDDDDYDRSVASKLQEIAVDPEFILNKSDTKAWTNRRPEPQFKYKRLKNGTLVEQK